MKKRLINISMFLMLFICSCATSGISSHSWIKKPPGNRTWLKIPAGLISPVKQESIPDAIKLLSSSAAFQLSENEARVFAEPIEKFNNGSLTPFLIRGLIQGSYTPGCFLVVLISAETDELFVYNASYSGELLYSPPDKVMEQPLIVYLYKKPADVYILCVYGGDAVMRAYYYYDGKPEMKIAPLSK